MSRLDRIAKLAFLTVHVSFEEFPDIEELKRVIDDFRALGHVVDAKLTTTEAITIDLKG